MASRYQPRRPYEPRQEPKSALEILQEGAYPSPKVGDEGSISPEVYLGGMQSRFDKRTSEIQGRRDLVKGVGKGVIYGEDQGWWDLLPEKEKKLFPSKASVKEAGIAMRNKILGDPNSAFASNLWVGDPVAGKKGIVDAPKVAGDIAGKGVQYAKAGASKLGALGKSAGESILYGGKKLGAKAVGEGAKALGTAGKAVGDFALGAKATAGNIVAGSGTYGTGAATGSTTAATLGSAVPPLLLATLAAKFIGSTKGGKRWSKKSNKWLRKKTGTGRSKNLLSPWKWRL